MNHAQPAEVSVSGAEGTVDDLRLLDQFRRHRLQRAEVSLAVSLRGLVLLDVIHHHLEASVHAAVIEVESKPAHFNRLAAAFVLAGIDSGVQLVEDLVVAGKEGLLEDFGISAVDSGLDGGGGNDDGGIDLGQFDFFLFRRLLGEGGEGKQEKRAEA